MGSFSNNAITDAGRILLGEVQMGATFTPTKIVIGSGRLPSGTTARTITAVVSPVIELQINKKQKANDGTVVIGGVYSNETIKQDFYFRELALYAKAVKSDGSEVAEVLYSYGNAGETADYMPAYTSGTPVERQIDLATYIGNDTKVNLEISGGIYLTKEEADILYVQQGTDGNTVTIGDHGVQFNGVQRYAAQNDLDFFPDGKTLLEYANECNVTTQVMVVQGHIPTDAPAQVEAHVFVAVGAGGRKTIIFMPYNNASLPTFARDIFNNAWNENAWRTLGGFATETADDLHAINECKVVQCYSNTLNTPYKEGLTNAAHGMCIASVTGNFKSLVYIATSSSVPIFYQACVNGEWGKWIRTSYAGIFKNNALYVGPTGNDSTGDGTSEKPYASLTKALSVIPKDLGGQKITINIAPGTYTEAGVNITDFYGGELEITGDSTTPPVFTNRLYAMGCSARISLKYIHTRATETWGGITASRCRLVEINDCKVDATVTGKGFGIYSAFMSAVYVHNTQVNNCLYGVSCVWGNMYVSTMTGTGNTYSAHAGSGGRIGIANTVPGYNTAQYVTYSGGRIYKDGQSNVPRY